MENNTSTIENNTSTIENSTSTENSITQEAKTKYCKHCGGKIPEDAVLCINCGRQVEEFKSQTQQPTIVINNENNNVNANSNVNQNVAGMRQGREKNKWVSLALCLLLGFFGGHKFYEGKAGMGVLYLFTGGLFGIGVIVDFITLLFKPNPYYVF